MRYGFLILILAAMVLAAGCTGGDQKPAVTPAQPAAPATVSQNPVVTQSSQVVYTTVIKPKTTVAVTELPQSDSFQTYSNKEFGFSIRIPASWTAEREEIAMAGGGKKYEIYFNDPTMRSSQYIDVTPDSAGLYLNDWANIFTTKQKADPSVTVVSESDMEVDGAPAKKIVLTTGSGDLALGSTIIMTVKGDKAYFMEFTSRKNDFPAYSLESEEMIRSFRAG